MHRDYFVGVPKAGSKGVRARIVGHAYDEKAQLGDG